MKSYTTFENTGLWLYLYHGFYDKVKTVTNITTLEFYHFIRGYYDIDNLDKMSIENWSDLCQWINDATISYWEYIPQRRNELIRELKRYTKETNG